MSYVQYGYRMRSPEEVSFDLRRFLGFGPADLEENRKGRLSAKQRRGVTRHEVIPPAIWIAVSLVATASCLHFPAELLEEIGNPRMEQVILIPGFLSIYFMYRMPWRLLADLLFTHIDFVEGKGDVEMRGVNDHIDMNKLRAEWDDEDGSFEDWDDAQPLYQLRIDGVRFPASKQVVNAIEEGHRYRAYYTRYAHHLLSVEPIADNVSSPPQT